MTRRSRVRLLVLAAALAMTGAIGLAPAAAAPATWQIASVVGDPAGQTEFSDVAASGPDNAWVTGTSCFFCTFGAAVEHWNGQAWQPLMLPDSKIGGSGFGVVVATSSAGNTWIFGADANNVGYGAHVTDSGTTETAMPAEGGITFTGAAVFSPGDAWAFGQTGDFTNAIFSPYAAHFDGQAWTELPAPPVVPGTVSAPSPDSLWILGVADLATGAEAIAHWTGSGWLTVPIPDAVGLKLPAGTLFTPISMVAEGPANVWVTAGLNGPCPPCGFGAGALLLHWNGNGWHSVDVPASINSFGPAMASDGHGGFWAVGSLVNSATEDLFHFLNDHWTSQPVPTQDGLPLQIGSLALVPGTTSLWGAATLFNFMPDGSEGTQGVIVQYNP